MTNLNTEKKQIDLISESICVFKTCGRCIDLHKKGQLTFLAVDDFVDDRGKSCLYRLKQMCHDLFRNTVEAAYKEKFYDITVGYIFHEAMKLRECIYQLEYYKPEYGLLVGSPELTSGENKVIREFEILIKRAEKRLAEGLKEVKTLITELVGHVKDLIRMYRNNYLLPRFILENEKDFIAIYGKNGYHNLLDSMYEHGRITLIYKAALSYLESEYYQIARGLFRKVVKLDPTSLSARFLYLYTSAFNCYFRNRYSMAQIFAEEALSLPVDGQQDLQTYIASLRHLLPELVKEIRKNRRPKEEKDRAYL
jgi:hypothetical protein